MTPELPHPQRERWQPLRGGLLNLYRYDYEEFHYEQGHLVLRGNNGTGKSRVLALQLPFLLDGEVSPYRLEPDGDPAKRIEWNLLLDKHEERLGYTFLELGRRDDQGEHFVTLGCGLHAASGRGLTARWFFVTHKRVGVDLFLQSAAGHALSRERLEEQLGEPCFTSARDYRARVDERLFGLGRFRYEALVDLLIQLRQPQLSRQLDEKRLSKALSEALPPLPKQILVDVSESFRSLEAERAALEGFAAAVSALERFLDEYRRYVQVIVRRRAQAVRSAHAAYEEAARRLRAAEDSRAQAAEALARLGRRGEEQRQAEAALRAQHETLVESPEMRDARRLDELREEARRAVERALAAEADRRRAEDEHRGRLHKAERAADAVENARSGVELAAGEAREWAERAALAAAWQAAEVELKLPVGPDDLHTLNRVQHELKDEIGRRRRGVEHLRQLVRAVERAGDELRRVKEQHQEALAEHENAIERERLRFLAVGEASRALVLQAREFQASLGELRLPPREELEARLSAWCETLAGESPLREAVQRAFEAQVAELAAARAALDEERRSLETERARLESEAARLREGRHEPPSPPHTRAADARVDRPGAPLWSLCDFAPGLDEAAQAGLEAALEAAGLLDAWVTPDGALFSDGRSDSQLVVLGAAPPAEALLDRWVIVSEEPSEVAPRVVQQLLGQLGAGEGQGTTWVDLDGRFGNGPLRGRFQKAAAEHLGAVSRERRRLKRLAEIGSALDELAAAEARLAARAGELAARLARARAEAAALPSDEGVRRAHASHAAAVHAVAELHHKLVLLGEAVQRAEAALVEATGRRERSAEDLGLAAEVHDLDGFERRLSEFAVAQARVFPELKGHRKALSDAEETLAEVARAAGELARRAAEAQKSAEWRAAAEARRDVLEQTVGAGVADVLARLAACRRELEALEAAREELSAEVATQSAAQARAEAEVAGHRDERAASESRRDEAVLVFRRQAQAGLFAYVDGALAEGEPRAWSTTTTVEVARRAEAALQRVAHDDDAWRRVQGALHQHFQTLTDALLKYDYSPSAALEDDLFLVSVPFRGRSCGVAELKAALTDEIEQRGVVLSAREREILENHLVGDVSMHLHELIRAGERWVDGVNRELRERPTSTGMTLRFDWRALDEAPAGFAEARSRLLRASGTWSPEEREALGAFLQQQIAAQRAAHPAGSWFDHLAAALDYRAWHQFVVERQQDGVWKRLTRRTHGTGSSGEKALALTVPQFAAAAAHYRSADPKAPRLILLDEVFVGIDNDMRAKCMGLLSAFDLDFVMTSEREWACYPTLPGVAIHQLATRPGIDAVYVTRWVWNGRQRVRSEPGLASPRLPEAAPASPASPADG